VLILGPSGSGKEMVAQMIHNWSPRADGPLVAANCAGLPESLIESELFGHTKGAFTGASQAREGYFRAASGGTLFLDEIGELPLPAQAKLLRTIETGEVQRVGAVDSRRVDVRVVAATNRDLRAETAAGRFRSDLLYRLNVVELNLPPLRDRREDIPYLTAAFVREFAARFGKHTLGPTPAAERVLLTAQWPGNVRELRNVVERVCIVTESRFFSERELLSCLAPNPVLQPQSGHPISARSARAREDGSLAETAEREKIARVLEESKGNKKAAAQVLGLSRRALYRRLDRLGLR
jgi:DNA-binding NtrC family response regulator